MSRLAFQNNRDAQGVYTNALMAQIYKTAAAGLKLGLASADFDDQNPDLVLADITDASFVGYTAGGNTVDTWTGPFIDPPTNRKYTMPSAVQQFLAGAVTGPQTIYGWYLVTGTGEMLAAGKFDTPIVISAQFQAINILPLIFTSGPDGPDALED